MAVYLKAGAHGSWEPTVGPRICSSQEYVRLFYDDASLRAGFSLGADAAFSCHSALLSFEASVLSMRKQTQLKTTQLFNPATEMHRIN